MSTWAATTDLWSSSPPTNGWGGTISAISWPVPSHTWATIPYAWDVIEDTVLIESLTSLALIVIASGRISGTFVLTAADGTPIGYARVSVVTQYPTSPGDSLSVAIQVFVVVEQSAVPSLLSDVTFSALLSVQIAGNLADTASVLVAVNISLLISVSPQDQVSVRFTVSPTISVNLATGESITVSAVFLGQVTAGVSADKQINVAIVANASITIGTIPGYTVSVDFDVVLTVNIEVTAGESVGATASFAGSVVADLSGVSSSVVISATANITINAGITANYVLNVDFAATLTVSITAGMGDSLTVVVDFRSSVSLDLATGETLVINMQGNVSIIAEKTVFDSILVIASMNISVITLAGVESLTYSLSKAFTLNDFPFMLSMRTSGEPFRVWQLANRFNVPWLSDGSKEIEWGFGPVLKGDWIEQNQVEDPIMGWQFADRFSVPWIPDRSKEMEWSFSPVLKGDWNVQNQVEDYVHWA